MFWAKWSRGFGSTPCVCGVTAPLAKRQELRCGRTSRDQGAAGAGVNDERNPADCDPPADPTVPLAGVDTGVVRVVTSRTMAPRIAPSAVSSAPLLSAK